MIKVLVVEDDPDLQELARQLLGQSGFFVLLASSLEEARAELAAHDPAFVVSDLQLPDGCGADLVREASADVRERTTFIACSGYPPSPEHDGLFALHLRKPYRPAKLIEALNTLAS